MPEVIVAILGGELCVLLGAVTFLFIAGARWLWKNW